MSPFEMSNIEASACESGIRCRGHPRQRREPSRNSASAGEIVAACVRREVPPGSYYVQAYAAANVKNNYKVTITSRRSGCYDANLNDQRRASAASSLSVRRPATGAPARSPRRGDRQCPSTSVSPVATERSPWPRRSSSGTSPDWRPSSPSWCRRMRQLFSTPFQTHEREHIARRTCGGERCTLTYRWVFALVAVPADRC